MSLSKGKTVLVTGASTGIGTRIALAVIEKGASLILFAQTASKLAELSKEIISEYLDIKVYYASVDVQDYESVKKGYRPRLRKLAISTFWSTMQVSLSEHQQPSQTSKISDILQMNNTNINGLMFTTYAVLNASFMPKSSSTTLNVSSITGLEVPPFPGEAVYHAGKACQEGFSNALRNKLAGTDIRVLVLRPGVLATNFHVQRIGGDEGMYDEFMKGFTPLEAEEVARGAVFMLEQPVHVSVKALDIVPTCKLG